MLEAQPEGGYHFLKNTQPIAVPFSAAVVADDGFEIVRGVLERPLPYRAGFEQIERHLTSFGRPRQALCSVELRCREPYTLEGFNAFNAEYTELLRAWGLFQAGNGVATRTNIAPDFDPPAEQVLHAFAYTVPAPTWRLTFVLSGAFERPGLRPNETSPAALREKTADVMATLGERLAAAGLAWDQVTDVGLYTQHDLWLALRSEVLPRLGPAARHGITWYPSRVPVQGFELEIDVRTVAQVLRIAVE
jgi:hypothetical protein